jgi:hypothetical protein
MPKLKSGCIHAVSGQQQSFIYGTQKSIQNILVQSMSAQSLQKTPSQVAAVKVILQHYFKEKQMTLLENCDELFQ